MRKLLVLLLISCFSATISAQCVIDKHNGAIYNINFFERNKKLPMQENIKIGVSKQDNGYQVVWNLGEDCFFIEGLTFIKKDINVETPAYFYLGSLTIRGKYGNERKIDEVFVVPMAKDLSDLANGINTNNLADKNVMVMISISEMQWEIAMPLISKEP